MLAPGGIRANMNLTELNSRISALAKQVTENPDIKPTIQQEVRELGHQVVTIADKLPLQQLEGVWRSSIKLDTLRIK